MVQWSFTNSIRQKHSMYFQLCYDSFKTFHIFIKNKNEIRFKTCFRESPCLSRMYFRNAVVHCKVVALSVSTVQNGTRRFSSSQQIRILRLEANTKGYHLNRWAKRKEKKFKRKPTHMHYKPWTLGTSFCLLQALYLYIVHVIHKLPYLYRISYIF